MQKYAVILAAGNGSRMRSSKPKVLHLVNNKPMLVHIISEVKDLVDHIYIVVSPKLRDQIQQCLDHYQLTNCTLVLQDKQLGTAHAVACCQKYIDPNTSKILILLGDTPLLTKEPLQQLLVKNNTTKLVIGTTKLEDPFGYGRIIRDQDHRIVDLVEQKDLTAKDQDSNEINTGIMLAVKLPLFDLIKLIDNQNQQQEYYLTSLIKLCHDQGIQLDHEHMTNEEVLGVNDLASLAKANKIYQTKLKNKLLASGLNIVMPESNYFLGEIQFASDCEIQFGSVLENVVLGTGVTIEANCVLKNCKIGDYTTIKAFSHIENTNIENHCSIGPYARTRDQVTIQQEAKIGNFVEIKNSNIGAKTKARHLSYIGDTNVGTNTNFGAGTITCNYDGKNKHKTEIGDHCFIGSGTLLVAPIKIQNNCLTGAGTVARKDLKENTKIISENSTKEL